MATGRFFQVELPEQKSYNDGIVFPVVLSPTTDTNVVFEEAIRAEKSWLESVLQKHGAIIFRGFNVNSPRDFNNIVEAFGFPEFPNLGGRAPRTQIVGRVYTANESPLDKRIPFHHELVYVSYLILRGVFFFLGIYVGMFRFLGGFYIVFWFLES